MFHSVQATSHLQRSFRERASEMKPLKRIFEKDKLRNRKSSPSPSRDNPESDPSSLLVSAIAVSNLILLYWFKQSTISPDSTLGSGNLRMAVALPEGEDLNEWIACNISDFYKQVSLFGLNYETWPKNRHWCFTARCCPYARRRLARWWAPRQSMCIIGKRTIPLFNSRHLNTSIGKQALNWSINFFK